MGSEKTPTFLYTPHPNAPLFESEDFHSVIDQVITEISSSNLSTSNEEIRQVLRQTGFVNLWFLLKFIAGYSGPFDKLNENLHLDMANFRQEMMIPGRKAAGFTPRGCYKTTIFTIGGCIFILLRDPDACIELFSCVETRSVDFFRTVQKTFDHNELFAWLYPEYVPEKNAERWNKTEMVLPNRTRHFTEPSLRGHGVGCSTQGIHGTHLIIDDPIGDTQLNVERDATAEMERISNWLVTNINNETLVKDHLTYQMFYTATRYGVNDSHAFIFKDPGKLYGFWDHLDLDEKDNGEWHIYNRTVIENGELIFPESFTQEKLEKMKEEDPWTYFTQYQNDPYKSGLNELNEYKVKECELVWENTWKVLYYFSGQLYTVLLNECDVVIATDPGATVGRKTSKTSKSATILYARDWRNNRFILRLKSGYVQPSAVFNWNYNLIRQFHTSHRRTLLETQGAFKLLESVWMDYWRQKVDEAVKENETHYPLKLQGKPKTGDKKAMIRNTLEPILKDGLLFAEKTTKSKIDKAIMSFPFGALDILDAVCLAERGSIRPKTEKQKKAMKRQESRFKNRHANAAGY